MKKYLAAFLGVVLVFAGFGHIALATASVSASPTRVQAGETVVVTGSFDVNVLMSVKVTDGDGNIVYFNAVRTGSDGAFSETFPVPDMAPGTLTVSVGAGMDTSNTQVTVYALKYFTVTFDKNDGGKAAGLMTISVAEGGLIENQPVVPARFGYTFTGWYKETEGSDAWDFGADRVTGNLTLYAGWNLVPVTASPVATASPAMRTPVPTANPSSHASSEPIAATESTSRPTATAGSGRTPTAGGHVPDAVSGFSQGTQPGISPGASGSPLAPSAPFVAIAKASGNFAAMLPWIALFIFLAIIVSVVLLRARVMRLGVRKKRNAKTRPRSG